MNKLALLFTTIAMVGCLADADDLDTTPSSYGLSLSPSSAQQILDLVNYPGTDAATLDTSAGLDSRAAKNIIAARNGTDGIAPSSDDVVFATIAQLDAVPQVGDAAFQKLQTYAAAHPAPAGETVEGVTFLGWQHEAIIWGVNQASASELDALLDDRAAAALVANRPFSSIADMGPLSFVGTGALDQLLGGAPRWWAALHGGDASLAGRFDGALFDEAQAETALQIVNEATLAQFTGHGITATPANHIVAARPFVSLAQVAAVSGVGSATMNALLAYAKSGQWGASASTIAKFQAAVQPHLADLLFLSESDRPLDIVAFPGAGTSAPTAASVLALVHATAGSTTEVRPTDNYFVDLEPSSGTADPDAAAAVQAAYAAQLTDVIYVAVHQPAGSIDDALVDVYLVGRTASGDLVGLHAIAVET
jgi:DNA uptake protein ComE-like DNA-binding protein